MNRSLAVRETVRKRSRRRREEGEKIQNTDYAPKVEFEAIPNSLGVKDLNSERTLCRHVMWSQQ